MKKRIVALLLALALCSSLMVTAFAETITFSDVPASYWGHKNIMQMTKDGLFKGTTEPVNGVGTFAPEKTMTRAEFVTAVLRAVYPKEAAKVSNVAGKWWMGYYHMALKYGILYTGELNNGAMDQPMSRQEMAMVLVRALKINKEYPEQLVEESQIADYASISSTYKNYVRECFSMGLIAGVDSKGTFAPEKSLTRAEAATVLCRLVYADKRVDVEFETEAETDKNTNTGSNKPSSSGSNKPSGSGSLGGNSGSGNNNNGNNNSGSGNSGNNNNNANTGNSGNNNNNANTGSGGNNTGSTTPSDPRDDLYDDLTVEEVFDMKDNDEESYWDFMDWLEDQDMTFEEWLDDRYETPELEEIPWENGGKSPERYTLQQYLDLSEDLQQAFREYFGGDEGFYAWMESKIEEPDLDDGDPFAGLELEDFTWEEVIYMDIIEQTAFKEKYFDGDNRAFVEWLDSMIVEPDLDE